MIPTYRTFAEAGGAGAVRLVRAAQYQKALTTITGTGTPTAQVRGFFVPGRVEVLGKHTDYAGGRSLLGAVAQGIVVVVAPRRDRTLRVVDADTGESIACEIGTDLVPPSGTWGTYPLTVVRRLARNFPSFTRGATLAFTSDLPQAAGLSSSSALLIAVYLALADVNVLEETLEFAATIRSREDLAGYLATIENGQSFRSLAGDAGVGTFGGSEDHTAILCCLDGHLAQYRFAPVTLERQVRLDPHAVFVIADSGVEARKTGEARDLYNRAARLAARTLDVWRHASGTTAESLGAAAGDPHQRQRIREALGRAGGSEGPGADLVDRFEQFCVESFDLVPAAADALERGDMTRFGVLVDRSQLAAEQWLRNQVPETVALAAMARSHGALAASAFGAGFGGSVWALVPEDDERRFTEAWRRAYSARFPEREGRARFLSTRPGPAAYRIGPAAGGSNLPLSVR